MGYLAGVFVVVDIDDVVKLRCAAYLGRKTVHEEEWYRHETALFVPCAIAGFTIPFGMSLPMAQHKAVFSSEVYMISYNPKFAEKIGSAVAAILLSVVVRKCDELKMECIESTDLQFELGFSDVELYSALKTLRDIGYMQTKNKRSGLRTYIPNPGLLEGRD